MPVNTEFDTDDLIGQLFDGLSGLIACLTWGDRVFGTPSRGEKDRTGP
jgi:hypothetical protein